MENFDEASEEIKNRRRKRAIKVFITEGFMVIAIACLVVLATMVATGYNVKPSDDGLIERTGLVAIQTMPTGANVVIDGEEVFGWTNLSRSMTQGEHEIVLYKEGYESWSKKINVTAGLYYRLNYPRLFLKERTEEEFLQLEEGEKISFAKDGNTALVYSGSNYKWKIVDINENSAKAKDLDLKKVFDSKEDVVNSVEIVAWSGSSERVLIKINDDWILLNVKDAEKSVNLSKSFGLNLSDLKIIDDSASEIYAIVDGNLRRIELSDDDISSILIKNVRSYSNIGSSLIYVADDDSDGVFEFGAYGNDETREISLHFDDQNESYEIKADDIMSVAASEYYGDSYATIFTTDKKIFSFRSSNKKLIDFDESKQVAYVQYNDSDVVSVDVRGDGRLIVLQAANGEGKYNEIFDIEDDSVSSFDVDLSSTYGWVDEYLMYEINENGSLFVHDFDLSNNKINIAENILPSTDLKISKNNKWIYFVTNENMLSRVKIME